MVKAEISLHVNRPVAEVFKYLSDPTRMLEWNTTLEEATASETPIKVGTHIRTRGRILGRKIEGTVEVVEYEPNKRVVEKLDQPFSSKAIYSYQAENGGTRLVCAVEAELGGFFKLSEPIFERLMRKQLQGQLETAKELLEAQLPATQPMKQSVSTEDNKAILRAHAEALFNQKRLDQMDEFFAPDYIDHAALPGQGPGLEGAKQKWAMYLAAFPDMRATIEQMVAEEDQVGVRWTVEGTHRRELLGIRPTGKHVRFTGISIYRLAGRKIAEQWEQMDRLDLMRQLGVVPTPVQIDA